MLRELMRLIAQGGPWTTETLARKLDTSPDMVAVMLEDLVRRGYVKAVESPLNGACDGACLHCSMAAKCATGSPQRVWTWSQEAQSRPS
jgi:predicted ArsR family transcriptional regulator